MRKINLKWMIKIILIGILFAVILSIINWFWGESFDLKKFLLLAVAFSILIGATQYMDNKKNKN